MATTATRKQAAAIRDQMQVVRNRLPYSMDEARTKVHQLTDWKYHASKRPWLVFAVVALVAYFIVPRKPAKRVAAPAVDAEEAGKTVAKASLASMLMSTIVTFALKTGSGLLAQRLTQVLEARGDRPDSRPASRPDSRPGGPY